MHKMLARKEKELWFFLGTIFVFFLLRFPSLFEPYWYGDEGIFQTVAMGINQGRLLYKDIWDNKTPLLYLVHALFNSDQFLLRLVSLLFGIASVIVFFLLAKKLFGKERSKKRIVYMTTLLFSFLFSIPLLEGNIANSENFMLFPTLLAGLYVFNYSEIKNPLLLILAGSLLSISFLFKIVAVFDLAAFSLFMFFCAFKKWRSLWTDIKNMTPFFISFSIPVIATGLFFLARGAFEYFYQGSFTQMVGYVGYGNRFVISQGLLIFKLALLALFSYWIFRQKEKFDKSTIFILLWFIFSLFNAFFAGRPYTHYMLVLLPSFVLFFGLLLSNRSSQTKKGLAILFVVVLFLVMQNFNFYKKSIPYYQNFISFMMHKKNVSEYRAFFDSNTPKDYETAQYITMHTTPNDSIFVWGNNAQLYKLTNKLPPGRFTVAYHMTAQEKNLTETQVSLSRVRPKYIIVVLPDSFPYNLVGYAYRININDHIIYERVY